ncbi:MAG: AraC family transcriptional regulator [Dorea sp.]
MKQQAEFINLAKTRSLRYVKHESVELTPTYCGYEECDVRNQRVLKKRDYYMLFVISRGKGMVEIDGEEHFVKERDALMIFPGMEYSLVGDSSEAWSYIWLGFTGIRAEECAMQAGFSREKLVRETELTEKMYSMIETMLAKREMTFSNNLKRNGLLKIFLSELIEENARKMPKADLRHDYSKEPSTYIRNALDYIAENYASKIKINELADYVGVNRSYLASSFKKATGCSPKEYLLIIRMEKAKSLLETTDMPINAISSSVGYTDQLAFSRMFKQYSGVSPRAYREGKKM